MTKIGAMTLDPNCMIAMNRVDLQGWDDFVDRVSEFNFATAGTGTTYHMGVILLGELTGEYSAEDLNFVHYSGTGEVLSGLERGEADIALPGTTTSGVKIVKALDSELFAVFSDRDTIGWFLEDFGVKPQIWGEDLDLPNLDTYSEITVLPRAFFGPPDVPEEVLQIQRDAFQQIIADDEFLAEAEEAGRPVVDPGDHERVEEMLNEQFEILESEPYVSILQDALGS
jgi:tripartite-type tricarboxylate transporter receptor subunit TctC